MTAITKIVYGLREDIVAEFGASDFVAECGTDAREAKYYVFAVGPEMYDPDYAPTVKDAKAQAHAWARQLDGNVPVVRF